MTDLTSAPAPLGIDVPPSAAAQQVKGQARLVLAALAGAVLGRLVNAHLLPAGLDSEPVVDGVVGLILYAIPAAWTFARVRLQHSRFWALAINPAVPDDLVRVAPPKEKQFMSIGSFLRRIVGSAPVATAVASAGAALTQAVEAAAQPGNAIGAAALAAVQAAEGGSLTGEQKKAQVVAAIVPVIAQAASKGGLAVLEAEAAQFAGMVVERVVADVKATPIVKLAAALLAQLGLKVGA